MIASPPIPNPVSLATKAKPSLVTPYKSTRALSLNLPSARGKYDDDANPPYILALIAGPVIVLFGKISTAERGQSLLWNLIQKVAILPPRIPPGIDISGKGVPR